MFLLGSLTGQKYDNFDYQILLVDMPETAQITSELNILEDKLRKRGEAMVADLQKEYSNLELYSCGVVPEKMAAKLKEKESLIHLFEKEMISALQKKEAELLQPLKIKIDKAIEEVIKESLVYFIPTQGTQIVYLKEQPIDLMNKVKSRLGI